VDVAAIQANLEGVASGMTSTERTHDFEAIFRNDGPGLWRSLYAYLGGRRDVADEAVAEAFARAIAYRRGIRDPLAWIYRTAFRIAAEEMRRGASRSVGPNRTVEPPALGELLHALRQLSPNQRAAIVLRFEEGLSVEEIARRMGIVAPTVRVHIHRGRKRLRELLRAEEVDDA
jgi:DNA-directed RNA polymerase specialized sigma24 family protein